MSDTDGERVDRRLGDAAVQAVLQTTQLDHERRLASLEERTEKMREAFDTKLDALAQSVNDKYTSIGAQYTRIIIWAAGAALAMAGTFSTLVVEILTRR